MKKEESKKKLEQKSLNLNIEDLVADPIKTRVRRSLQKDQTSHSKVSRIFPNVKNNNMWRYKGA